MDAEEKEIASLRATGLSYREIEAETGVSKSKVGNVLRRPDVIALVESESSEFIKVLPVARRNIQSLIEQHDSLPDDSKDKQRAWASSMEVLRSAGMLPGHMSPMIINNIQINNNQIISPVMSDLLQRYGSESGDDD